MLHSAFLFAQPPEQAIATPAETTPQRYSDAAGLSPGQPGVVVLTDGQVLRGLITEIGGGYRVDHDGAFSTVPYERVKVTSPTIAEAYQRIHETMRSPLAGDHLILCEWCLKHELWNEAKLEVALALKLEPLRADAQALLWRIEQKLSASASPGNVVHQPISAQPVSKRQDSTGLSRELQQQFIRQVQPLLMNKCASAGCHGRESEREFRLNGTRSSNLNYRLNSDGNLTAILQQIDFTQPQRSPIVAKPGELTASHRKLFQGPSGGEQRQLLIDWVNQVARELGPMHPSIPPGEFQAEAQTAPACNSPPSIFETSTLPGQPVPAPAVTTEPEPLDNAALRAILRQQAPDPFDPEDFNMLVHGRRFQAEP